MTRAKPVAHSAGTGLSPDAQELYRRLKHEFGIVDGAGEALLRLVCESHDRAQRAKRMIDAEGEVFVDRFGQRRPHPAVRIEHSARMAMLAGLRSLNLDVGGTFEDDE
jgi:phage terminase small subunit